MQVALAQNFHIRPIGTEELPVVCELARAIWPAAYAGILTPEQIANMLETIYTPENLAAEMASGHRFWLATDPEPVGYVSAFTEGDTIWIKKLYVLPACQGRGTGKALMRAAVSAHLPAAQVSLLVNPNNTPAQAFYTRAGFTQTGTKPVQMGDFQFCDCVFSCAPSTLLKA